MPPTQTTVNTTVAILVVYHPSALAIEQLSQATTRAGIPLVIISNDGQSTKTLGVELSTKALALLENNNTNGLAGAQNMALQYLDEHHPEFSTIFWFDQDSQPSTAFFTGMLATFQQLKQLNPKTGLLAPQWTDSRTGTIAPPVQFKSRTSEGLPPGISVVDAAISSGSLMCRQAVREVGHMDARYFIDHIDTEWCIRARLKGWALYHTNQYNMQHAIGDARQRVWLGRWREVSIHSPMRNHYVVRNTFLLVKTPGIGHTDKFYLWRRLVLYIAYFGLFTPPRWVRLKEMLKGIRDGLRLQ